MEEYATTHESVQYVVEWHNRAKRKAKIKRFNKSNDDLSSGDLPVHNKTIGTIKQTKETDGEEDFTSNEEVEIFSSGF